jgi:glycosyltransferase involved in cell wall biosynthesis
MADWIVLFVSSSRPADSGIISKLEASGVRVFRGYYEDIQTFYQLADLYLFPVSSELGAVDLPLSILEALACNLPVVSTPYHGIRDVFRENDAITYFTNGDDVINLMRNLSSSDACSTRQSPRRLVEFKTYENLVHALLEYIRESSKRSDCTDLAVRSNAGKHK